MSKDLLSTTTSPIAIPPTSPILLFSIRIFIEILKESQTMILLSLSTSPNDLAASSPISALSILSYLLYTKFKRV